MPNPKVKWTAVPHDDTPLNNSQTPSITISINIIGFVLVEQSVFF